MVLITKPKEVLILPDFETKVYKNAAFYNVLPGDTIVLRGNYRSFYLKDLIGAPDAYITVVCEDPVTLGGYQAYAMIFENSSYINIVGFSGRGKLMIDGKDTGTKSPGMALNKCHHVLIDGVDITNVSVGIMAKTTPKSETPGTYESDTDQFSYDSITIQNCNTHDITGEGVYIGCSTSDLMPITISGVVSQVYAYRVKNLRILKNTFKNTGWDGIQATCCDGVVISGNNIDTYGVAGVGFQKYGIICAGNNAMITFNKIANGTATGITGSFNGPLEIGFNNIINAYGVDQDAIYVTAHAIKDYGKCIPNIYSNYAEHCGRNMIRVVNKDNFMLPGVIHDNTWKDSKGVVDESGSTLINNHEFVPPVEPPVTPAYPYPVSVVMSDGTSRDVAK